MSNVTFDEIRNAIFEARDKGARPENLRLVVTESVYEMIIDEKTTAPVYSFSEFLYIHKRNFKQITFFGVEMVPAEWGNGWTLESKEIRWRR